MKLAPNFSHIYVESAAREFPASKQIIQRFKHARVIEIKHYKEVFNRVRQDQLAQKRSQKLILARQTGTFLYPGTESMQDFGHQHFFYNLLAINCIYDCSYCFLQGMYSSANLVLFVNSADYFEATKRALFERDKIHLCLSYQTDLLGIENIYPYCREWIEFAKSQQNLLIEIRTKSANFAAIAELQPSDQVILAWTLSPGAIAAQYERGAASLERRLEAARCAQRRGWKVRICIDPILMVDNWAQQYTKLIEQVFSALEAEQLLDISVGTLRLSPSHFKKIRRLASGNDTLMSNLHISSGCAKYSDQDHNSLTHHVVSLLERHLPASRIHLL